MKLTEILDTILESTNGKIENYAFFVGYIYEQEAKELVMYKGIKIYTFTYLKSYDVIYYMEDYCKDLNLN
jgi:hypothetical protein